MENFNALLTLSELKTLYSGKPVGICPLYEGVLSTTKTFEATGNPITIPEYKSLVKLKTDFSPKQAGSGDPSPENVRPISGRNSLQVTRCGLNLWTWDKFLQEGFVEKTEDGIRFIKTSGIPNFDCPPIPRFMLSYEVKGVRSQSILFTIYNSGGSRRLSVKAKPGEWASATGSYDFRPLYIKIGGAGGLASGTEFRNVSLVQDPSTPYEPYQGDTYDIALPETVYGGTVDAVTGVGSKTWDFIASYNGESLPGEWISDRDVYAPGTTPTTGAQVAYKLAAPVPFKVSQFSIPSLRGENYFFTNGENMDIIYKETSFWG